MSYLVFLGKPRKIAKLKVYHKKKSLEKFEDIQNGAGFDVASENDQVLIDVSKKLKPWIKG